MSRPARDAPLMGWQARKCVKRTPCAARLSMCGVVYPHAPFQEKSPYHTSSKLTSTKFVYSCAWRGVLMHQNSPPKAAADNWIVFFFLLSFMIGGFCFAVCLFLFRNI